MKIKTISFTKTFPVGLFWEKIMLEAEIIEGDDVRKSLYELKKQTESFFYESNAAAEKQAKEKEPEAPKKTMQQQFIDDVNSCTDMKILKTYEFLLKQPAYKHPAFKNAYDKKFAELSNSK